MRGTEKIAMTRVPGSTFSVILARGSLSSPATATILSDLKHSQYGDGMVS